MGQDSNVAKQNKTEQNEFKLNDIKIEWDTNKWNDLRHHRIETNAIVNEMKHEQSEFMKKSSLPYA